MVRTEEAAKTRQKLIDFEREAQEKGWDILGHFLAAGEPWTGTLVVEHDDVSLLYLHFDDGEVHLSTNPNWHDYFDGQIWQGPDIPHYGQMHSLIEDHYHKVENA